MIKASLLILAFLLSLLLLIPNWVYVMDEWKNYRNSNDFISNLLLIIMILILSVGSGLIVIIFINAFI